MTTWPAETQITPLERAIEAVVRPPGSKSITNRALIAAGLAVGTSELFDPLDADDTEVMRRGLSQFGVDVSSSENVWQIQGRGSDLAQPQQAVDAGASGTTFRFLTALSALAPGKVTVTGTERMRQRPISDLTQALTDQGVKVETKNGFPPVVVGGGGLSGGQITVRSDQSSQFLSAMLLVAPWAAQPSTLKAPGLVSVPYVESTTEVMGAFGAQVSRDDDGWTVNNEGYQPTSVSVEADASAAVYPLVATAIVGGEVTIEGIPPDSVQADLGVLPVLEQMGCSVAHDEAGITLAADSSPLSGVDVDLNHCPDGAMALAVAALFADAPSRLSNLSTLRLKETDRLNALVTEIGRIGGSAQIQTRSQIGMKGTEKETEDLIISPGKIRSATIETYDDHRMAMAFALVGLRHEGIVIKDPGCVRKTWPSYFEMLSSL